MSTKKYKNQTLESKE